jgi:hypothetical protein
MSAGVVSHRRSQTAATDETEAAEPREWDPGGAASLPWDDGGRRPPLQTPSLAERLNHDVEWFSRHREKSFQFSVFSFQFEVAEEESFKFL